MKRVIGICGRAGSGKSTAAEYLRFIYNGVRTYSLASPLKDLTKLLFDFTEKQVRGTQAEKEAVDKRYGFSPRTAMIRLGDGGREILGKRIWMDACFRRILDDYALMPSPFVLIDDVRYPNEAEAIATATDFRGYVIKLVCPDSDSNPEFANAPSEASVDEVLEKHIYATIVSRKSPESTDLKSKIHGVLQRIVEEG